MAKHKNALRWLPCLTAALLLLSSPVRAEVHSFTVEQLKHTSSTLPDGSSAPALSPASVPENLPAAVPYNTLQMPTLPTPKKIKNHQMSAVSGSSPVSATSMVQAPPPAKVINIPTCRAALQFAAEEALASYQQSPRKNYMALVAGATLADDNARAGMLPNLAAFNTAADDLPWFGPQHDELKQATQAVQLACTPPPGAK